MNCRECEKNIPNFIQKKMDYRTMSAFSKHLSSCPSCREELEIRYLVDEGMQRLETGESFLLETEIENRLKENERAVSGHIRRMGFCRTFLLAGVIAVGILLIWYLG